MTHSTYELIAQTITDNHTTKELKAITDSRGLEVTSSSTHSYSKLKEDYISAVMGLLVDYNGEFQFSPHYAVMAHTFKCADELIDILTDGTTVSYELHEQICATSQLVKVADDREELCDYLNEKVLMDIRENESLEDINNEATYENLRQLYFSYYEIKEVR